MNFNRSITSLCIFCMILLFVQCDKEEMLLTEGNQPDAAQNLKAKKVKPSPEGTSVVITGDVTGTGLASTSVREYLPFTLTLSDPFPNGTHDGVIRILYSTKKKGENRIDFKYTDVDGVNKCLVMRKGNPNMAYNPLTTTMTLDICELDNPDDVALIGWWVDGVPKSENYKPALAVVVFTFTDTD